MPHKLVILTIFNPTAIMTYTFSVTVSQFQLFQFHFKQMHTELLYIVNLAQERLSVDRQPLLSPKMPKVGRVILYFYTIIL